MKQVFWVYEGNHSLAPQNSYSETEPELRMRKNGDLAWNTVMQAKMGYPERVTVKGARENGTIYIGIGAATAGTDSLKVSMEGGPKGARGNIASCACCNKVKKYIGEKFIKTRAAVSPEYESGYYWMKLD